MPCLLPRIVALLRLRTPPQGLGSHMLAQLPYQAGPAGPGGQASLGDEAGDPSEEELEVSTLTLTLTLTLTPTLTSPYPSPSPHPNPHPNSNPN